MSPDRRSSESASGAACRRKPFAHWAKQPLVRLTTSRKSENVQSLGVAGVITPTRPDAPQAFGGMPPTRHVRNGQPARRRAAKITCAVPPPDNRCRDGSERNRIPRAIAGTGAIQHGSRSTVPRYGITGKGGWMPVMKSGGF